MTIPLLVTSTIFDITLFRWQYCGPQVAPMRPTPFDANLSHWLNTPWPPSLQWPCPARGAHPARRAEACRADRRHPAHSCGERSQRSLRTEWLGLHIWVLLEVAGISGGGFSMSHPAYAQDHKGLMYLGNPVHSGTTIGRIQQS